MPFRSEDTLQTLQDYPNEYLDFIQFKSGRKIEIHKSAQSILVSLTLCVLVLTVVVFVLYKVVHVLNTFPILMAVAALIVQGLSTSGIFYSVQHGMKMFGVDPKTRQLITFAPNTRSQYLGEGLMMSSCSLTFGLCMLAAVFTPSLKWGRGTSNAVVFLMFLAALGMYNWVFFCLLYEVWVWYIWYSAARRRSYWAAVRRQREFLLAHRSY